MPNQNPEQIARDNIDRQLNACGWLIQGLRQINLHAGMGIAVREYLTNNPNLSIKAKEPYIVHIPLSILQSILT